MKIAVVTDDGETISRHFGRAEHYLVFSIDDEISGKELRPKAGHKQFNVELHEHHDHDHSHGHGHGEHSAAKHQHMMENIADCSVLLSRGMGNGAYIALEQANIKPIITDIADAQEAVKAYLAGTIVNHTERLH